MSTICRYLLLVTYTTAFLGSILIFFHASTAGGATFRNRVVIVCISGRAGVPTESEPFSSGMANLCKKLQSELLPLVINPANIFHRSWNHNESDNPFGAPWVSDLNREIESRTTEPSYLALIGHSYGGWVASRLSNATTREPDLVVLVDPVFGPTNSHIDRPRGRFIKNWYQRNSITPRDTCTGLGATACFPANNGISCGAWVDGANDNVEEEFHKDWNGIRKRTACPQGHVHVQTWHTMMDDDLWIWRQIRDRLFDDLSRLLSSEDSLEGLYQAVLGRAIDDSGRQTHAALLAQGWTLGQVRNAIAHSPEAHDRMEDIYQAVLGRVMDDGGWQTHSNLLASAWTLGQVRDAIAHSPEAYGHLEAIYQAVLGRTMEDGGWQTHAALLAQGWTLRQVRNAIAHSPEASNDLKALFQEIWRRPIDSKYLDYYTFLLSTGETLADVQADMEALHLQTVVLPVLIAVSLIQ